MGGIGKTTLAEVVFNQISSHQFEGVCFIQNVREKLENSGGLDCLQNDILSKVLNDKKLELDNPTNVPSIIKKRLNQTKVFIVLDDVDDFMPLETLAARVDGLGQGSRIIITFRDKQVLRNCGVNDPNIYGVEEFNRHEALQLFYNYAFKQNHPTEDLKILSNDIVNYAKGNPLALKVLGSSLNQKSKKVWVSAVNKLRTNVDRKILNVLKLSYDGLNVGEQEVFLDIACFLKGENRDYVVAILDDCECLLSVLIDKSLITVSYRGTIEMHDLLQDLGRDIVHKESSQKPGERSRLWRQEDVLNTLKHGDETNAVQGIFLNMFGINYMHLSLEAFNKMYNLRLLKFYNSLISYDSRNLSLLKLYNFNKGDTQSSNKVHFREGQNDAPPFDKLRSFIWFGYPWVALSSKFNLENLVELNLCCSSNLERLWGDTEHAPKLKWLDLHDCPRLIEVPDLSKSPFLEKIDLGNCSHLTKIQNLSNLALLEVINLYGCSRLTEIPDLSGSSLLRKIDLRDCSHLTKIQNLSNLALLEVIYLHGCSRLTEIPDLSGSSLLRMIDIQDCRSLLDFPLLAPNVSCPCNLNLKGCESLRSFPSTIVLHYEDSKYLDFSVCINLTTLPQISGNIEGLDLSGIAIDEVPSSIENLIKLSHLILSECTRLKHISANICKLKSLMRLNLENCSQLESFPEILDKMESLESLILSGTAIKELPHSIENLTKLLTLNLSRCNNLESLPNSICNLISLKHLNISDCPKLEILPDNLGDVKSLEVLLMHSTAISQLPSTMMHLNEIVTILCGGCRDLRFNDLLNLPSCLRYLYLNDCNLKEIPEDIGCLSSLECLELSGNNFQSLPKSMKQLYKLTSLEVDNCNMLRSLTDLPSALEHLSACDCKRLRSMPDASEFANLVEAEFIFTNSLNLKETAFGNMLASLKEGYEEGDEIGELTFCCPGSKVPGWLYESSIVDYFAEYDGEVFKIKFQMPWYDCFNGRWFVGFVVCAVIVFEEYCIQDDLFVDYMYTCSDRDEISPNNITVGFSTRRSVFGRGYITVGSSNGTLIDSDHIAFGFCKASVPRIRESDFSNCSFEFWLSDEKNPNCRIKSCGVYPIYVKHNIKLPSFKKQKT